MGILGEILGSKGGKKKEEQVGLQQVTSNGLFDAIVKDYEEGARAMLDHGADCNTRNEEQATPLHVACVTGREWAVRLLIEAGAEINAADCVGFTPLHLAAARGHTQIITLLLERGANKDAEAGPSTGNATPYSAAVSEGHMQAASLLKPKNTSHP